MMVRRTVTPKFAKSINYISCIVRGTILHRFVSSSKSVAQWAVSIWHLTFTCSMSRFMRHSIPTTNQGQLRSKNVARYSKTFQLLDLGESTVQWTICDCRRLNTGKYLLPAPWHIVIFVRVLFGFKVSSATYVSFGRLFEAHPYVLCMPLPADHTPRWDLSVNPCNIPEQVRVVQIVKQQEKTTRSPFVIFIDSVPPFPFWKTW